MVQLGGWAAAAMRTALDRRRFGVGYERISFCGGVFSLRRTEGP